MFIIDRLEEEWAVIEANRSDRKTFNLPRVLIPAGAREGDVLDILITVNQTATANRERQIKQLADELFED